MGRISSVPFYLFVFQSSKVSRVRQRRWADHELPCFAGIRMTTYRSGSLIRLVSESALLCFGDIFIPLCAPRVYSRGSNLALSSVCSAGQTFTPLGKKIDKFRILAGCKFAYRKADAQRERSEKQTAAQVPGKRNRIDFSASGEKEHLQPKKSRLQIYNSRGSVSFARDRQRTRLG